MSTWLKWVGGCCPVDDNAIVYVRLRNGMEMRRVAHTLTWHHLKVGGDIMEYMP